MLRWSIWIVLGSLLALDSPAQTVESAYSKQRLDWDLQWLKAFDQAYKWTLFSRTRASWDFEHETSTLFAGGYLNRTVYKGFGPSLTGNLSSFGGQVSAGIHGVKQTDRLLCFALLTVELQEVFSYAWFSMLRYKHPLKGDWKLYGNLELYSSFQRQAHALSIQRIRLGLGKNKVQCGWALDLTERGSDDVRISTQTGIFIRKEF